MNPELKDLRWLIPIALKRKWCRILPQLPTEATLANIRHHAKAHQSLKAASGVPEGKTPHGSKTKPATAKQQAARVTQGGG
jgi:hypothetical protein